MGFLLRSMFQDRFQIVASLFSLLRLHWVLWDTEHELFIERQTPHKPLGYLLLLAALELQIGLHLLLENFVMPPYEQIHCLQIAQPDQGKGNLQKVSTAIHQGGHESAGTWTSCIKLYSICHALCI